jgi:hypothetical protein
MPMQKYRLVLSNDLATATKDIQASSPEEALEAAFALAADQSQLEFKYLWRTHPVHEILLIPDEGGTYVWLSDEERVRLAAPDLLAAAKNAIARWQTGDLAAAMQRLSAVVDAAEGRDA